MRHGLLLFYIFLIEPWGSFTKCPVYAFGCRVVFAIAPACSIPTCQGLHVARPAARRGQAAPLADRSAPDPDDGRRAVRDGPAVLLGHRQLRHGHGERRTPSTPHPTPPTPNVVSRLSPRSPCHPSVVRLHTTPAFGSFGRCCQRISSWCFPGSGRPVPVPVVTGHLGRREPRDLIPDLDVRRDARDHPLHGNFDAVLGPFPA